MILDWPNLIVGAILGAILGFCAHWAFVSWEKWMVLRELGMAYSRLAGDYLNFRVDENGAEEATGGTIRLTWQSDGSFKAQGLHSNGDAEWESIVEMALKTNTGAGKYNDLDSRHNHGVQQVTYLEKAQVFSVMTTVTSLVKRQPFVHRWRRKVTS